MVFAKDPLLFGDPKRQGVAADGAVSEKKFRRRVRGVERRCKRKPQRNNQQTSSLHASRLSWKRIERIERFERLELFELPRWLSAAAPGRKEFFSLPRSCRARRD